MNGSVNCGQQNSVVEQRNVKTFLLDVPGDINVYKFWITSLYCENRNVLIHELHTVSQCLHRISNHSIFDIWNDSIE